MSNRTDRDYSWIFWVLMVLALMIGWDSAQAGGGGRTHWDDGGSGGTLVGGVWIPLAVLAFWVIVFFIANRKGK